MSGDVQVRFCERPGVRSPRATHRNVYVRSERAGLRVMASLKAFIEKRLKLKVNDNKSKVARPQERTFLSFKLHKLRRGPVRVLLAEAALRRLRARVKEMTPRNWGRSFDDCILRLNRFLRGWLGYFAICHRAPMGAVDSHVRRRLRALLLKQWKRKKHIVNQLIALGVPVPVARVDVHARRRSWWA